MTLESDALADTALRFSEAVRAERTSTLDALASERQAALQIIASLRAERARRSADANNRFLIGIALGVAVGAAVIYVVNQRASEEARLGLASGPSLGLRKASEGGLSLESVRRRLQAAIADGKRAAAGRETELWQRYRDKLRGQGTGDREQPGHYD
jgi:gas vesicle protein